MHRYIGEYDNNPIWSKFILNCALRGLDNDFRLNEMALNAWFECILTNSFLTWHINTFPLPLPSEMFPTKMSFKSMRVKTSCKHAYNWSFIIFSQNIVPFRFTCRSQWCRTMSCRCIKIFKSLCMYVRFLNKCCFYNCC